MNEMHDDEMWLVKLDDGQVRMMTLEALDEAFQAGTIHEDTMICRDGGDKWLKLSEEIGGTEEEEITHAPTPTPTEPAPPPSMPLPSIPAPPSAPPVVADLDDHHEVSFVSSRKRTRVVGGVIAVAVVGAFCAFAIVTAVNVSHSRQRSALAAQIAAAAAAEAEARAASDPEPETVTTKDDANKTKTTQRRRNTRTNSGGAQQPADDKPAGTVFKSGGDEHDPLNAKL